MFFNTVKQSRKGQYEYTPARKHIDGGAYSVEGRWFYCLQNKVFEFVSNRAYESWGVEAAPLEYVPQASGLLGFRHGTLLSRFSNGNLYLVSNNRTRHITSPDVLFDYGLSHKRIYEVSEKEFNVHEEGEPIDGI